MNDATVQPVSTIVSVEAEPDDFFITCASWEGRCLGLLKKLAGYRCRKIIIFAYKTPNPLREQNLKEMQRVLGALAPVKLIRCQHLDPIESAQALAKELSRVKGGKELKVTWDVSGFTKRHLLVLLEATRVWRSFSAFQCYQTEPAEYPVSGGAGRSRGISSSKTIELLRGPFFPSKDTVLVIFLGYEGHRAHSLWQNLEPNRTLLVIPDPPYRASWAGRTEKQNNLLLSVLPSEVLYRSHSLRAIDTVELLERMLLAPGGYLGRYNLWIAPFGTKAQTLGLFWFCAKYPQRISVVNASPVLYETANVFVPAGESWLIGAQRTVKGEIVRS